jgi:outer membrane biosynthesis protein TonB
VVTKRTQVEEARSKIRTLTLQQEILSMVLKRLFEAEDNSEITRDERERLGKSYESEMKGIAEELNKAELIVSLNELEEIRTSIIQQFQETLADTQTKIDLIIRELHIEQPKPEEPTAEEKPAPRPKPRRQRPRPAPAGSEEEAEEEEAEEAEEEAPSRADAVEDRLERLKKSVLKELEELDKLELEAS